MFKKLLKSFAGQNQEERRAELYRNLIRHEARIGGQLFGAVPMGTRREFFCLDENTWVWHEEWTDNTGKHHAKTTRYDVRPNGILKSQDGHYEQVSLDEGRRLHQAAQAYRQRVRKELYSFV